MESLEGSASAFAGYAVRRKRSSMPRRPRSISGSSHSFIFLPPSAQPTISHSSEEYQNYKEKIGDVNGSGSENKLKLKLKLGGIPRTIHGKPTPDIIGDRLTYHFDACKLIQEPVFKDDERCSLHFNKGKGNGVKFKDSRRTISLGKDHLSRRNSSLDSMNVKGTFDSEPIRKSKRAPKRRVLDLGLNSDDNDEEDEEILYLDRLRSQKTAQDYEAVEDEGFGRRHGICRDQDDIDEGKRISDDEPGSKKKKLSIGSFAEGMNGPIPTTRNRSLQSGKGALSGSGSTALEFPNGLPPAPSKKQKEKLSEEEQQLKKAEAAQRRRMQSEKAAREAEAEAIRKILGQDSGRKKREEKMKKQQEELEQERAAKSITLASNTVRWVFGSNGTIVTFSEDVGLPNIFKSVRCSYPPPREKCVGPNCENAYKYRDSKSKLPVCSLHCYKAVQEKMQRLVTC